MKKFIKVTILLVLLTLMLVSSCLVGFAKEKVITFSHTSAPVALDPCDNYGASNFTLDYLIYDRLIDWGSEPGLSFVPALATEWKSSPDRKEYTFKLRKGVKFHNGEPFNAECVKVTLERFLTEKTLRKGYLWEGLKEVEVVDDYTVIIRYNAPNVTCLYNLVQTPILPAKAFKEKGTALFDNPIGTGAFTWGYWKRGQEIVVNKNPDYWGEPAYMDKFVYLPVSETSTRLASVLTGEMDVVGVMLAAQIPLVESSGSVETIQMLAWDQIYLALKNDKPPFTDIKFRQAIALAIDKEGIAKTVIKGSRVSTGIIPKGINGFDDSLVPVKQDIEKAKQLVKESIYDGRTIDIMVPIGWFPNEKEFAQVIKGNLDEIGINTTLSILESGAFVERRAAENYDIFLNQDSSPGDMNKFLTRGLYRDAYKMGVDPELKKLILEQAATVDRQKRIELIRKIENMINIDFAPIIMVCQYNLIYFQQKGVQGVRYYGDKNCDYRYAHYKDW